MKYYGHLVQTAVSLEACTGCGMCLQVCPRHALAVSDGKARLVDRDACIECGACARNCPFQAITVNTGVGCANALIRGYLTGGPAECGCDCSGDSSSCC